MDDDETAAVLPRRPPLSRRAVLQVVASLRRVTGALRGLRVGVGRAGTDPWRQLRKTALSAARGSKHPIHGVAGRCRTVPAIWDMRTGWLFVCALTRFWDTRSVVGTCPHKHRRRIDQCLRNGSQPRKTGQKAERLEQGSGLSAGDVGGVSVEVLLRSEE